MHLLTHNKESLSEALDTTLATRFDIAELKTDLVRWMAGFSVAVVGILFALIKLTS
ncbi:MAG: hypothetical protein HON94_11060 [Methylococcales bacterium]|nr:hypothetical protein [Methylococcales bacterium]MBT7411315.1 hypothetical protein [Methylococcales bacterium]